MKNTILILLIFISVISCKTEETNFTKSDLNSISFYDFDNKSITVVEITKQWNERIQKDEEINAVITNLEITNLTDQKNNESELILLGNTNSNSVQTATKLTKFKDGLKLNEISVTCNNCNISLYNGDWTCVSVKKADFCEKIETLREI